MVEYKTIPCIVCDNGTEADLIARVAGGCIVAKNEIQPLCNQHWVTCTPIDDSREIIALLEGSAFNLDGSKRW